MRLPTVYKEDLSAIPFFRRSDGEVNPVATFSVALDEQFVEVFLSVIGGIEENGGIAYRLFHTYAADIHGAARQMVARISPAHGPVHIRRTIAARDDDGFYVL